MKDKEIIAALDKLDTIHQQMNIKLDGIIEQLDGIEQHLVRDEEEREEEKNSRT